MEYRRPSCLIRQCFTFPSALYTKHYAQNNYYYHHTCSRPVFRIDWVSQHQNVKTLLQEMMQVAVVKAVTLKHVQVICTSSSSQINTSSIKRISSKTIFSFCLTRLFSRNLLNIRPGPTWIFQRKTASARILPAGCLSCRPTNSVRALKEFRQN